MPQAPFFRQAKKIPPSNTADGIFMNPSQQPRVRATVPIQSKLICTFIMRERSPAISKASTAWAMG